MKNAGHITEEDYISYLKDFIKRSTRISDTWELSEFNEKPYLMKKVTRSCSCKQDSELLSENFSVGADISDDDSAVVSNGNSQDILTFEYHIIYSESYSVPVLYFNVYRQDGSLLPLHQVWKLIPDHYRERLVSDKWTFLTQTEHPYLGRPFYQLHPCHTDKLMACVFTVDQASGPGSSNYLIGWLCAVGPVVLLDMPFEYGERGEMPISKTSYGNTDNGEEISIYTLKNNQVEVRILDYGGIITNIFVPDKNGKVEDIALGFDAYKGGYDKNPPYFGALIGRYANRIAKGHFTLDGVTYNLTVNNGPNALHGGTRGFDKHIWTSSIQDNKLVLQYTSADGEEHYPGEVKVTVTYQLTDQNELIIDYNATTNKKTVINLTNHAYFNLAGHAAGSLAGHIVRLAAYKYTPVDSTSIPTGVIADVQGTMYNLTTDTDLVDRLPRVPEGIGFDHNFVLEKPGWDKHAARMFHSPSGRQLDMYTTEPGVQFYTAYFLNETNAKGGATYGKWGAFCFEAQHYPDSPNEPSFPTTVLSPGETYRQTTKYVFSITES